MIHCAYEQCSRRPSGYLLFTPVGFELPYCETHRQRAIEHFDAGTRPTLIKDTKPPEGTA